LLLVVVAGWMNHEQQQVIELSFAKTSYARNINELAKAHFGMFG